MDTRTIQETFSARRPARNSGSEHDIICIGFGSSSIALAIALQETAPDTNILFLERHQRSKYAPGIQAPGTYMQLHFLNDLVSQENPRSKFSYLNYLRSTDQLINFANLGSIQPLREQFGRYLRWCAAQFDHQVQYGSKVESIRPSGKNHMAGGTAVEAWEIEFIDTSTGERCKTSARQVVCAVGLQPKIPAVFKDSAISRSILQHSSLLDTSVKIAKDSDRMYHVVVIGQGQEAAEATETLCNSRYPPVRVTWVRGNTLISPQTTHSSVCDRLFEYQYSQKIREHDPRKWKLNINDNTYLKHASRDASGKVHLICGKAGSTSSDNVLMCDYVVVASGYWKAEQRRLLRSLGHLLHNDELSMDDRHGIKFKQGYVHDDCGIWMLGSLANDAETHENTMAQVATESRKLAEALNEKLDRSRGSWDGSQLMRAHPQQYQLQKARL